MRLHKFQRVVLLVFIAILLIVIPVTTELYHPRVYCLLASLLIVFGVLRELLNWDKAFEEKFYQRWRKARQYPYYINVAREGLRGLVFILAVVSMSQYIFNDRTPLGIISALSGGALIFIVLLLLFFFFLIGIIAAYEKEKRYKIIDWEKRNSRINNFWD